MIKGVQTRAYCTRLNRGQVEVVQITSLYCAMEGSVVWQGCVFQIILQQSAFTYLDFVWCNKLIPVYQPYLKIALLQACKRAYDAIQPLKDNSPLFWMAHRVHTIYQFRTKY